MVQEQVFLKGGGGGEGGVGGGQGGGRGVVGWGGTGIFPI